MPLFLFCLDVWENAPNGVERRQEVGLKRDVQVKVRMTTAEYMKIKSIAGRAGYSLSGFIRARCLEDKKIIIQDADSLKEIYRELNLLGNNVNQLARIANATKVVHKAVLLELLELVRMVRLSIDKKLKGVGG